MRLEDGFNALMLGSPRFNALISPPTNDALTPGHDGLEDIANIIRLGSDRRLEDATRDVGRFIANDPTMTREERDELVSSMLGMGNITRGLTRIPNPIRAYHGSPHRIGEEGFRMDRIGTGSGGQAFGPGISFAGDESLARGYRDYLVGRGTVPWWQRLWRNPPGGPGHLYEVNLHATPAQLLGWATPNFRLPPNVAAITRPFEREAERAFMYRPDTIGETFNLLPRHRSRELAEQLRGAGFHGVRFGESTMDMFRVPPSALERQYTIWSPEIIEIMRRYGLLGPVAGGAAAGAIGNSLTE